MKSDELRKLKREVAKLQSSNLKLEDEVYRLIDNAAQANEEIKKLKEQLSQTTNDVDRNDARILGLIGLLSDIEGFQDLDIDRVTEIVSALLDEQNRYPGRYQSPVLGEATWPARKLKKISKFS